MHARRLDVLHNAGNPRLVSVPHGVHVHLDRVLQEEVQQDVVVGENLPDLLRVQLDLLLVDGDPHSLPAEHVARTDKNGIPDPFGRLDGLTHRGRHAVGRIRDFHLFQDVGKLSATLRQIHHLV